MTTTDPLKRLLASGRAGEVMPKSLGIINGELHHVSGWNKDGTPFHCWPVEEHDELCEEHIDAVKGRLTEWLAKRGVVAYPEDMGGNQRWRVGTVYRGQVTGTCGELSYPTMFAAQVEAFLAIVEEVK